MKLIAHRGLTHGPSSNLENQAEQFTYALGQGFDIELDIWYDYDDDHLGFYLGHDKPTYHVNYNLMSFFLKNSDVIWFHAKNLKALNELSLSHVFKYFWHEKDKASVTSCGHIWTYPGEPIYKNSIMVLPEMYLNNLNDCKNIECFAICSDYVSKLRDILV